MKRDTNDYFNFRSTNGGHYLLTRLPVWATAGIMIGILMTVLVGRSLTEGLMYNIAYSSMVGDAALMIAVLIGATILQRYTKQFVYTWPRRRINHIEIMVYCISFGVITNALTLKSRSGQVMDTYHDLIIAPILLYLAIILIPTIFRSGNRVEKLVVSGLVLVWLALVGVDIKQDRMNQRQWLHNHISVIEQMK